MISAHRYIRLVLLTFCAVLCTAVHGVTLDASSVLVPDSVPQLVVDTLSRKRLAIVSDSLYRSTVNELGVVPLNTVDRPVEAAASSASAMPVSTAAVDSARKSLRREQRLQKLTSFTPDPNKATWAGIVFPGGGQIYNHKYWKLPIVYGGFLGCAYALNWNNQMYSDYSQAYLDIMDDDPGTASYEDFLPPRYNVEANKDYLKRVFKNRKDNYRRQRDMSIFCFIGVYLISVVDAYVDAELSNFDITEDLTVQVRPSIVDTRGTTLRNQAYGLQCSFSF